MSKKAKVNLKQEKKKIWNLKKIYLKKKTQKQIWIWIIF